MLVWIYKLCAIAVPIWASRQNILLFLIYWLFLVKWAPRLMFVVCGLLLGFCPPQLPTKNKSHSYCMLWILLLKVILHYIWKMCTIFQ